MLSSTRTAECEDYESSPNYGRVQATVEIRFLKEYQL